MKVLKNIVLILAILLSTSFIHKGEISHKIVKPQAYGTQVYTPWKTSGSGYWTTNANYHIYNDFDFMITRSTYPNSGGYYFYDFWFFSQSYYWNGYGASYTSTNITGVSVYVGDYLVVSDYSNIGITFNKTFNATSIRIMSKSTKPNIHLKWGDMKAK